MSLQIRSESGVEEGAIRRVHEAAFPTPVEADLVDALRRDGDLVLSLVAEQDGIVVGHVAFSRMRPQPDEIRAIALGPIAVLPDWQRSGIATALIGAGLEALATAGEDLVLVLGEPAFYGRFGFSCETARGFRTAYDGPYLQAHALRPARHLHGSLAYAPAFAALE